MRINSVEPVLLGSSQFQGFGCIDDFVGINQPIPVLTFSDEPCSRISNDDEKISDSIEFSALKTPNEYWEYAKKHGSLFGVQKNDLGSHAIHPISELELLRAFDLIKGKKAADKISKAIKHTSATGPESYELLADWIIASKLLKLASGLQALLEEDFDIHNDDDGNYFVVANTITRIHVSEDDEYIALKTGVISSKNVSAFYDENTLQKTALDRIEHNQKAQPAWLSMLNTEELIIGMPLPEDVEFKDKVRRLFQEAIDALVNYHLNTPTFNAVEGKMTFIFNSRIAYLWADFLSAINGIVEMSTCVYCGSPFARTNRGPQRQFCSNGSLCYNNYRNNSKSRPQRKVAK